MLLLNQIRSNLPNLSYINWARHVQKKKTKKQKGVLWSVHFVVRIGQRRRAQGASSLAFAECCQVVAAAKAAEAKFGKGYEDELVGLKVAAYPSPEALKCVDHEMICVHRSCAKVLRKDTRHL